MTEPAPPPPPPRASPLTEGLKHPLRTSMRYVEGLAELPSTLAYGLRTRLAEGYGRADFRADLLAGLVVGVVALPLSMALAIASGVPPQYGLYTAMIAGTLCALLGGARLQVTGPTAAFVVILLPIVKDHGIAGLLVAGLMAGVLQILMGMAKLGRLMTFIPHPVTTGFTAGIALVIGVLQVKDIFGMTLAHRPEGLVDNVDQLWIARGSACGWDLLIGMLTLALLIYLPRKIKKVPAPLIALVAAGLVAAALGALVDGFHVRTIGAIPAAPPMPVLPWHMAGADGGEFFLSFEMLRTLLPSAFAIAMLGAIESLLAAVVADGMAGTKHDPNCELIALGISNVVCPFFGGIPATGALARTATNIRAGATSPFAAVIHALFLLTCTIALAPLVGYLPMAAMGALLLVVARNMSEVRHFAHLVRVAPRSDVIVLLTCFTLTALFDMVVAVSVGVVLAALMFMRRMADLTNTHLDTESVQRYEVPPGVRVYRIAGPLFFGAAQKAMDVLEQIGTGTRTVILSMSQVPVIDATGLVALESLLAKLQRSGHKVIIAGMVPPVREMLDVANIKRVPGKMAFAPDVETALSMAILHQARLGPAAGSPLA